MKGCRLSTVLRVGSLGALLTLNACSGSGDEDEDFKFDKADMESALHGNWVGTWTPVNGTVAVFELAVRAPDDALRDPRRGEPGMRMACGNRTFSESGPGLSPLCVTETFLTMSATADIAGLQGQSVDLDGYAVTPSMILSSAYLDLSREGAPFRLSASWDSEQGFTNCSAFADDGASVATCTLDERR